MKLLSRSAVLRFVLVPSLTGLVAAWGVYGLSSRRAPAAQPVSPVVVARHALPARVRLGREDLEVRRLPADAAGPGAIRSPAEAVGRVTTVPLAAGEILYTTHLAGSDNPSALAYRIPSGRRAATIRVNEVSGVGGFIQPGDRVDVVAVLSKDLTGRDEAVLLLQDVPVLAVGRDQQGSGGSLGGAGSQAAQTVTLALEPSQAVTLALADQKGAVRLLLRPAVHEPSVQPVVVVPEGLPR